MPAHDTRNTAPDASVNIAARTHRRRDPYTLQAPHISRMFKRNPFLHVDADRVYDPLTDRSLVPGDAAFEQVRDFGPS